MINSFILNLSLINLHNTTAEIHSYIFSIQAEYLKGGDTMKSYIKPSFEYIELTLSERVSWCDLTTRTGRVIEDGGCCPS